MLDLHLEAYLAIETPFVGHVVACKLSLRLPCCGKHEVLFLCMYVNG